MTIAPHDTGGHMSPIDAFERICVDVISLEAIANAASVAIDQCRPPEDVGGARRSFDRAQALIGSVAEKAAAAVTLIEKLKDAVRDHAAKHR
jgi:hypothetical protein